MFDLLCFGLFFPRFEAKSESRTAKWEVRGAGKGSASSSVAKMRSLVARGRALAVRTEFLAVESGGLRRRELHDGWHGGEWGKKSDNRRNSSWFHPREGSATCFSVSAAAGAAAVYHLKVTGARDGDRTENVSCEPLLSSGGSDEYGTEKEFGPNFVADAAEKAIPALVNISSVQQGPWGRMVQSAGSGFIIRSDGLIATNAHVVKGAKSLTVTLYDGRQLQAKVLSADAMSDLALVLVDEILEEPLPVMEIGDSSGLRPGEFVIALGSPLNLGNSVTAGIVSSTARGASEIGLPQARTDYIQTDAAINQGNSGGPLINLEGRVVGINTMKVAGGDGIGFAIPINTAWVVLSQLRDSGKVVRPYIGLRMAALTPPLVRHERRHNTSFPEVDSGLLVVKVADSSPAKRAGIRPGDIIVEFDGKKVKSVAEMTSRMAYEIGKSFSMVVVRQNNRRVELQVTTEGLNL